MCALNSDICKQSRDQKWLVGYGLAVCLNQFGTLKALLGLSGSLLQALRTLRMQAMILRD